MPWICKNLEETKQVAKEIAPLLKDNKIILLKGDLGSGKTTFTKFLAEELGIDQIEIKSPTYTYIRKYKNIYHLDLYRVKGRDIQLEEEIEELIENPENILVIEWPEKISTKFDQAITVNFEYIDKNTRKITKS